MRFDDGMSSPQRSTFNYGRAEVLGHRSSEGCLRAQYPERATKWVVIDAPLPGIGPWDEIIKSPMLWHFNFRGPDVERLVAGRERIYLDRFWNELSFKPKAIDEATRDHYAELYALPGAMHSAFNQFAAFNQDAADNKALAAKGKLAMPVLAHRRRPFVRAQMGDIMHCRVQRDDRRHSRLRALGHGGAAGRRRPRRSCIAFIDKERCRVVTSDLRGTIAPHCAATPTLSRR